MPEYFKVRIEVPFALLIFAFMFADSVTTNWVMYRTCYVTMGFNKSECALLGSKHPDNITAKLEEKVQPHVAIIGMTRMLIEAFSTSIVCFFIGPWSDKFGRKPVFLLTFGGYIFQHLILAVICVLPDISPWYILLSAVPLCFSGGLVTLLAAVLCYITDITTPENRGFRIAVFYAIVTTGYLLGSISSSYALRLLGYFVVYLIGAACIFLAWLIIYLFLPESVANPQTEHKFRNLFKISLLQETVQTTFKRRDNYDRILLFTIIFILVVYALTINSDGMLFLYVREKFHWSLETYTMYNSINTVTEIIGTVGGIYILHKLLGVKESIVITIGFLSMLCGALWRGLATKNWHIYASGASKCFGGAVSPISRSLVSKVVPDDEYGKIFSFIAICESIISPLGSPMYTYIYNNTLKTFPGAFSLVTAGIYVLEIIFCIAVIVMQMKQRPVSYENLNTESSVNHITM